MTNLCHNCGEEKPLDPYSYLCMDCLIAASRARRNLPALPAPGALPFDAKAAAAGDEADELAALFDEPFEESR